MAKSRRTLNVSPELLEKLKKLQGKIKAQEGQEPNLTDLTNKIFQMPQFDELEKQLIQETDIKIGLKFDRNL